MDILECFRYGSRKFNSSCALTKFIQINFFCIIDCICEVLFMLIDTFFAMVAINLFTHHITRYSMWSFVRISFQHCRHSDTNTHAARIVYSQYLCTIIAFQLDFGIFFSFFFGILCSHFSFSTKYLHFSTTKYLNKRIFQYLLPNAAGETFVWICVAK